MKAIGLPIWRKAGDLRVRAIPMALNKVSLMERGLERVEGPACSGGVELCKSLRFQ